MRKSKGKVKVEAVTGVFIPFWPPCANSTHQHFIYICINCAYTDGNELTITVLQIDGYYLRACFATSALWSMYILASILQDMSIRGNGPFTQHEPSTHQPKNQNPNKAYTTHTVTQHVWLFTQ